MKLTGETKGLALVLDTAPLKARRWSRLKVSPARCAAGGLLGAIVRPFLGYQYPTWGSYSPPPPPHLSPAPPRSRRRSCRPMVTYGSGRRQRHTALHTDNGIAPTPGSCQVHAFVSG
eukprot:COSAG01_NODE_3185_length_6428_cov_3.036722_4_plen_117_part_00